MYLLYIIRSSAVRPTLKTLPPSSPPHPSPNIYLTFLCFFGLSLFLLVLISPVFVVVLVYVRINLCLLFNKVHRCFRCDSEFIIYGLVCSRLIGHHCLSQHLEDGYERKMLTRAACVDLSAAYDTVQHRLMIRKLMDMTGDIDLCQVIRCLLSNRSFFVQLNDKKSRWRRQKNGFPQGSVLAPLLCNIYTSD